MKKYQIWQGETLCADAVSMADTFFSRFRGLMLRPALAPGEGLLLRHCPAIHCCFMRFPIDVVYLDDSMAIVGVETVFPWRVGRHFPGARHTLELGMGRAWALAPGMRLTLKEADNHE